MKTKGFWMPFTQEKNLNTVLKSAKIAKDAYIWDENGKRYVDLISSWWVNCHGHCNEYIKNAIKQQLDSLDHVIAAEFTHEPLNNLVQKLDRITNGNFFKFFFSDNGSTAVEVGIKIAWQYWKNKGEVRDKFLTFNGCYHGDTLGAMSVGRSSKFFTPFEDLMPVDKILVADFPSTWIDDEQRDFKENEAIKKLEKIVYENKNKIAFAILEPLIQGAAGMRFCSESFLQKACQILKDNNIILIFDEVMTGFGKTGKMFAYEHLDNFIPDIVCVSKSITGGFLPLGVNFIKEEIYDAFYSDDVNKAFLHGHSYTANPIACSAACASIDLFNDEVFLKIKQIEDCYKANVLNLGNKIEKVRIKGLICAFDVKNQDSTYGNDFSRNFKEKAKEQGFLIRPLGNTIYLLPPFCVETADVKTFLTAFTTYLT
jgi:adenosylmethionine-8-amino-7-oxononanoate aminotransferase